MISDLLGSSKTTRRSFPFGTRQRTTREVEHRSVTAGALVADTAVFFLFFDGKETRLVASLHRLVSLASSYSAAEIVVVFGKVDGVVAALVHPSSTTAPPYSEGVAAVSVQDGSRRDASRRARVLLVSSAERPFAVVGHDAPRSPVAETAADPVVAMEPTAPTERTDRRPLADVRHWQNGGVIVRGDVIVVGV